MIAMLTIMSNMDLFASHQLEGPAADWWDAYVKAHEEPESIN
jgi:hypothetical protein